MNNYEIKNESRCEICDFISGNSTEIVINKDECEVRADFILQKKKCIRLWGQVTLFDFTPVIGALVNLVKINKSESGRKEYTGVAHTFTDSHGFYQFDICENFTDTFKVIVSKPMTSRKPVFDSDNIKKI